ncbi:MAG: hypothetical protein IT162_14255 [Bryobacterales bacterium]|nr:hypothetical protein [Bryobacterales bacterium]
MEYAGRLLSSFMLVFFTSAWSAPEKPRDPSIIYVDPPLRVVSACELRKLGRTSLICQRDGVEREVRISRQTKVWKGRDLPGAAALQPGDWLDIKLGVGDDGRETAAFIWANLVKVEGVIGPRVARNWVYFYPLKPATVGDLDPAPVLLNYDGRTEFIGGVAAVRPRTPAIVIGQRLDQERVYATRMVISPR